MPPKKNSQDPIKASPSKKRTRDVTDEQQEQPTTAVATNKEQPTTAVATSPPSKKQKIEETTAGAAPLIVRRASSSTAVTAEQIQEGTVPFVRRTTDSQFEPKSMLKIVSWNVAGLRALLKKDPNPLEKFVNAQKPDILCLQETKLSDPKEAKSIGVLPGYVFVDAISTAKKGYSGTRTYLKESLVASTLSPVVHHYSLDPSKPHVADDEGRVVNTFLELPAPLGNLVIVNNYVPNAGMKLERLEYRTETYDPQVRTLLQSLQQQKGTAKGPQETFQVIWVGDLNVAERDYDRYFATNFKAMQKVPGFTPEERASFRKTLHDVQLVDSFRHLYPNARGAYTFFSAKFNARALGNGWRLDYAVVSKSLADRVVDSFMMPEVEGSDHSPVLLWLK